MNYFNYLKVIRVLEELEEYALRYESERDEEHSLGRMVDKLDAEKRARAEERLRYERVLLPPLYFVNFIHNK